MQAKHACRRQRRKWKGAPTRAPRRPRRLRCAHNTTGTQSNSPQVLETGFNSEYGPIYAVGTSETQNDRTCGNCQY